jgi:hypothetical protein
MKEAHMATNLSDLESADLSREGMTRLTQKFYTRVLMKDYYKKRVLFNGPINRFFYNLLEDYDQHGEIEPGKEFWNKEYLPEEGGWGHIQQKLYRHRSKYQNQLHLTIDIYLKKKGWFTSNPTQGKYSAWDKFWYSLIGMELTDSLFPVQKGDSEFLRDITVGYLINKHLDNENIKAEKEDLMFDDV